MRLYWLESNKVSLWAYFESKNNVYQIIKNWGPGLYNSVRHADNRKYFSGPSLMRNEREAHMFYLAREVG